MAANPPPNDQTGKKNTGVGYDKLALDNLALHS